ncbi:MAG: hypothetical protein IPP03_20365 [Dechloromonas sp.]|nr:hypothetical protein [Candidatus Dechloromonas phosphoritropha]
MDSARYQTVYNLEQAAALCPQEVLDLCQTLSAEITALKQQIDWFKRQIFGQKSERRIDVTPSGQLSLGEFPTPPPGSESPGRPVAAHTRQPTSKRPSDESVPFFDENRVPVEVVELTAPEVEGLSPEDYEVISHKDSYRLAQRPGSYVVIKYRRPVIKLKSNQTLVCANAPAGVIEGSRADVSFVAGLLIDKFAYHLPLYRQHQRRNR